MKVLASNPGRFAITPDNQLWALLPSDYYGAYTRFLDVFDSVRLVVRAERVAAPPEGYSVATGPGVTAEPLPYYVGLAEYAKTYFPLQSAIRKVADTDDAIFLQIPCPWASSLRKSLAPERPYGVEVMADPYDTFSPGAHPHLLSPFFRRFFSHRLREDVRGASAVSFVTREALQRRYRPVNGTFSTYCSNVELPAAAVLGQPRVYPEKKDSFHLICVGAFSHFSKAPDISLKALRLLLDRGRNLKFTFVGSGVYLPKVQAMAQSLGVGGAVQFLGRLGAGQEVYEALDAADLFVLPSRQEGVPRAMIEAMARGLPCIGSTIGGIPELLPAEDMVPPNDAEGLAALIEAVVADTARMNRMAAHSLKTAREYTVPVLAQRRRAFYLALQEETKAWRARNGKKAAE